MRLRSKPRKPKRKTLRDIYSVQDGMNLAEIINHFDEDPKNIRIDVQYSYCDHDGVELYALREREQTDEEYEEEIKKYKKRLDAYNKWYMDNKAEIEGEIARRKEELESRKAAVLKRETARLEKELAKLKKKL